MGAWDVKLVRSASYAPKEVTLLQKQSFVATFTTDIGKGLSPDGFKGERIRSNKHTQL